MDNFIKNLKILFKKLNYIDENNLYSIKELNEILQKKKKIKTAKKYWDYFSELNKKQKIWLKKSSGDLCNI